MRDETGDDATLCINITPGGHTEIRVDGELVGLLEEVTVSPFSHPPPNVKVKFISTGGLPPGEEKNKVLEQLHYFRAILGRCPQVRVLEEVETLPRMMALRPSSIPPSSVQDDHGSVRRADD
jgi:hypothetical protein